MTAEEKIIYLLNFKVLKNGKSLIFNDLFVNFPLEYKILILRELFHLNSILEIEKLIYIVL